MMHRSSLLRSEHAEQARLHAARLGWLGKDKDCAA
jgi:hypothetical protein